MTPPGSLINLCKITLILSIQAFIIFMGMTTIYFFRPFIPIDPHDDNKKTESRAIYLLPSLLDVLGTICDTAGLFYVQDLIFRQVYQWAKCSKDQSSSSPISSASCGANASSPSSSICGWLQLLDLCSLLAIPTSRTQTLNISQILS